MDDQDIKAAYAAYDSDPRVGGPDDRDAFIDAVTPLMPDRAVVAVSEDRKWLVTHHPRLSLHDHKFHCDDLWRYEEGPEDFDDEPGEPWELADPSCAECGGQGGWIEYVGGVDETEWVMCPCTEEAGNA